MTFPLLALALSTAVCTPAPVPQAASGDSLRLVWEQAQEWDAFREAAHRRAAMWTQNWERAAVPAALRARADAVAGDWRLLVIAEPGCSDSLGSIPWIARLAADAPGLDLRIVNAATGRPWLEAHRTPDGRAATPTVLLLDAAFEIRGCWVEQPARLQEFWLDVVARGITGADTRRKLEWYAEDEGRETLREIVEMLEAATGDVPRCPGLHPHR